MQIAMIDCETTGLEQQDQPISIAIVICEIDTLGFGEITDIWYGEQHPVVPISDGAFSVHGRTRESLYGKQFDFSGLPNALRSVQLVIAHNADFDARMIAKAYPEIRTFPWYCSYKQWPFEEMHNKRLDTICDHFKIDKPLKHDAISDAKRLHLALMQRQGKTARSKTYLHRLIQRSAWIEPINEFSPGSNTDKRTVRINQFTGSELKELSAGSKMKLEGSVHSDRLTAYRKKGIFQKIPVLSILKSENPHIAEKIDSGCAVYLLITENDGRSVDVTFHAEEPAV